MKIRKAIPEDAAGICRIYNYYITDTPVTFELVQLSMEEMRERIRHILDGGFPYYVGECEGKIVGYAYLHTWKERPAYRFTQEITIYLDKDVAGKGYGTELYRHLFDRLDREKTHTIIAGITLPNEASVRVHEKFGFHPVAHMQEMGWKFDQWHDVGYWQWLPEKVAIVI